MNYTKMFSEFGREIVGLDIGGANLKAAVWRSQSDVRAASISFPMWKQPERLADGVRQLLGQLEVHGHVAVTMTGELADCFATRSDGVAHIIEQLLDVVSTDQLSVYAVDGRWLTADQARHDPWSVAASNWHALANWLAQWPPTAFAFACGLLVDIGSTTVDILPMVNSQLATEARTDRDRLELSQLIYTGIRRTPVCAVVNRLALDGASVPTMAELFATVDDAYILLGLVAEDINDCDSADGRPRTWEHAAARLARMIGEDAQRLSQAQLCALGAQVIEAQAIQLARAIEVNLARLPMQEHSPHLIYSGHGLPLFEQTIRNVSTLHRVIRLNEIVADEVSRSAPAAAVAWLRSLD